MVGLINFHFSNGMLSLFVDQELENGKTFRNGFTTYDDAWNVLNFNINYLSNINLFKSI